MVLTSVKDKGNVIQCFFEQDVSLTFAFNIEFEVMPTRTGLLILTNKRSENVSLDLKDPYDIVLKKCLRAGYLIPSVSQKESSWLSI